MSIFPANSCLGGWIIYLISTPNERLRNEFDSKSKTGGPLMYTLINTFCFPIHEISGRMSKNESKNERKISIARRSQIYLFDDNYATTYHRNSSRNLS